MSAPCNNFVQVVQNEDPCRGKVTSAKCVVDSNLYAELNLEANSTQQQINQALYLAFISLNTTVNSMQVQIDNLQNQIP